MDALRQEATERLRDIEANIESNESYRLYIERLAGPPAVTPPATANKALTSLVDLMDRETKVADPAAPLIRMRSAKTEAVLAGGEDELPNIARLFDGVDADGVIIRTAADAAADRSPTRAARAAAALQRRLAAELLALIDLEGERRTHVEYLERHALDAFAPGYLATSAQYAFTAGAIAVQRGIASYGLGTFPDVTQVPRDVRLMQDEMDARRGISSLAMDWLDRLLRMTRRLLVAGITLDPREARRVNAREAKARDAIADDEASARLYTATLRFTRCEEPVFRRRVAADAAAALGKAYAQSRDVPFPFLRDVVGLVDYGGCGCLCRASSGGKGSKVTAAAEDPTGGAPAGPPCSYCGGGRLITIQEGEEGEGGGGVGGFPTARARRVNGVLADEAFWRGLRMLNNVTEAAAAEVPGGVVGASCSLGSNDAIADKDLAAPGAGVIAVAERLEESPAMSDPSLPGSLACAEPSRASTRAYEHCGVREEAARRHIMYLELYERDELTPMHDLTRELLGLLRGDGRGGSIPPLSPGGVESAHSGHSEGSPVALHTGSEQWLSDQRYLRALGKLAGDDGDGMHAGATTEMSAGGAMAVTGIAAVAAAAAGRGEGMAVGGEDAPHMSATQMCVEGEHVRRASITAAEAADRWAMLCAFDAKVKSIYRVARVESQALVLSGIAEPQSTPYARMLPAPDSVALSPVPSDSSQPALPSLRDLTLPASVIEAETLLRAHIIDREAVAFTSLMHQQGSDLEIAPLLSSSTACIYTLPADAMSTGSPLCMCVSPATVPGGIDATGGDVTSVPVLLHAEMAARQALANDALYSYHAIKYAEEYRLLEVLERLRGEDTGFDVGAVRLLSAQSASTQGKSLLGPPQLPARDTARAAEESYGPQPAEGPFAPPAAAEGSPTALFTAIHAAEARGRDLSKADEAYAWRAIGFYIVDALDRLHFDSEHSIGAQDLTTNEDGADDDDDGSSNVYARRPGPQAHDDDATLSGTSMSTVCRRSPPPAGSSCLSGPTPSSFEAQGATLIDWETRRRGLLLNDEGFSRKAIAFKMRDEWLGGVGRREHADTATEVDSVMGETEGSRVHEQNQDDDADDGAVLGRGEGDGDERPPCPSAAEANRITSPRTDPGGGGCAITVSTLTHTPAALRGLDATSVSLSPSSVSSPADAAAVDAAALQHEAQDATMAACVERVLPRGRRVSMRVVDAIIKATDARDTASAEPMTLVATVVETDVRRGIDADEAFSRKALRYHIEDKLRGLADMRDRTLVASLSMSLSRLTDSGRPGDEAFGMAGWDTESPCERGLREVLCDTLVSEDQERQYLWTEEAEMRYTLAAAWKTSTVAVLMGGAWGQQQQQQQKAPVPPALVSYATTGFPSGSAGGTPTMPRRRMRSQPAEVEYATVDIATEDEDCAVDEILATYGLDEGSSLPGDHDDGSDSSGTRRDDVAAWEHELRAGLLAKEVSARTIMLDFFASSQRVLATRPRRPSFQEHQLLDHVGHGGHGHAHARGAQVYPTAAAPRPPPLPRTASDGPMHQARQRHWQWQ